MLIIASERKGITSFADVERVYLIDLVPYIEFAIQGQREIRQRMGENDAALTRPLNDSLKPLKAVLDALITFKIPVTSDSFKSAQCGVPG